MSVTWLLSPYFAPIDLWSRLSSLEVRLIQFLVAILGGGLRVGETVYKRPSELTHAIRVQHVECRSVVEMVDDREPSRTG